MVLGLDEKMHREQLVLADGEQGIIMVITLNIFTCTWFTKSSGVCWTVGLCWPVGFFLPS